MFCSKACEYAIRSMIYLSDYGRNKNVTISKLSEELDISFTFLTKILQPLTEAGYLQSHKGAKGGVCINKPLKKIYLSEIIKVVSGQDVHSVCASGGDECSPEKGCPLHDRWQPIKEGITTFYETTSLENYKESMILNPSLN